MRQKYRRHFYIEIKKLDTNKFEWEVSRENGGVLESGFEDSEEDAEITAREYVDGYYP